MAGSTIWAPVGDKGPDGDKGPPGDQGPVGPQGPPGPGLDSVILTVATVADLRNVNKVNYRAVQTRNYDLAGDKGGNFYILDPSDITSLENGCTVIVGADGGRWKPHNPTKLNLHQCGAIGDGLTHPLSSRFATLAAAQVVYPFATALTDELDWAAKQAAYNTNLVSIEATEGVFKFNKGHTRTAKNTIWSGATASTVFDYSGSASGDLIEGAVVKIQALSISPVRGARSLTFASPPSCVAGDVLCIYNPTNGSWLSNRDSYRAGEYVKVHSVSGNVVSIYGELTDPYVNTAVDIYRIDGVKVVINNIKYIASAAAEVAPLKIRFGVGVRIQNYFAAGGIYTGLELERCYDFTIAASSSINNSPYVGDEYGLTISNCQLGTITGGAHAATRHAIALGGGDFICCVSNRYLQISGCTIENLGPDIGSGDTHGNCDKIVYDNMIFRNGVNMAGRDITVRNSRIYGVTSTSGEIVYGSEIVGGIFTIENCVGSSNGDGTSVGYVHITPSATMKEDLNLIVDMTLDVPGGTLSKAVWARGRGIIKKYNVEIKRINVLRATVMAAFLYPDDSDLSTFLSDYLIVDKATGPVSTYLIYPTADILATPSLKTRQMDQRGYGDITTTATNVIVTGILPFRYKYSKMPNVAPGLSKQDGANQDLVGSVAPSVTLWNLTDSTIRLAMVGTTNFPAALPLRLHYSAGISEI